MNWTIRHLDYFLDHFFEPFFYHFLDHFVRGGGWKTISSQGGVGCSLTVLWEGWEADCYYLGKGGR